MMRKLAWFLIISSVVAAVAELTGFTLPTISWAFNTAHDVGFLHHSYGDAGAKLAWFGYAVALVGILAGVFLLFKFESGRPIPPTTARRIQRFKQNRRGYISFIITAVILFVACLDQVVVGKRALYLSDGESVYFPAFQRKILKAKDFDQGSTSAEVNYRELSENKGEKYSLLMPLIPFDPTEDSVPLPFQKLEEKEGKLLGIDGEPFSGRVSSLYDENAQNVHITYEYRKGLKKGEIEGKDRAGKPVYKAQYLDGKLVKGSEDYSGSGSKDEYLNLAIPGLYKVFYHPAPPMPSKGHYLGTTTDASDLLAYLYGGLQVNIKAAIIYIPAIYIIGVSIGLLMGFFGGTFDLILQRVIEIFSTIPFLFVVIIFSGLIKAEDRGLGLILGILILFGWMGMTYLMRTAALKEKARDYVAAARVMGASTPRIIFHHILPNTMAVLVTLIPFSVSGIIMSLTALDYLGFGLPPEYATWGTLLKDGLSQYSKPWLVSSAFISLVGMLILITFVGEAVRDAFDPKKFTTYK